MFDSIFQWLYLIGLIGMETIRFPYRMQNKRDRRAGKIQREAASPFDISLELLSFLGAEVIPFEQLRGARAETGGPAGLVALPGSPYPRA